MEKYCFGKILGHNIIEDVQKLIREVITYFPKKELLIHPLYIAEQELGETINYNVLGSAELPLNKYIGIWIKEDCSTSIFNTILAEELYHYIQAYKKYPFICGLKFYPYQERNKYYTKFKDLLVKIILDLDAHNHLISRKIDLTPLQLQYYNDAIKEFNSMTKEQLDKLFQPNQNAIYFPQYLLLWYDLYYLSSPFKKKWETDINQWFLNQIHIQTQKAWYSLIKFIEKYPINSRQSSKKAMTKISRKLIYYTPLYSELSTTGKEIAKLIIKELVPKLKTTKNFIVRV